MYDKPGMKAWNKRLLTLKTKVLMRKSGPYSETKDGNTNTCLLLPWPTMHKKNIDRISNERICLTKAQITHACFQKQLLRCHCCYYIVLNIYEFLFILIHSNRFKKLLALIIFTVLNCI